MKLIDEGLIFDAKTIGGTLSVCCFTSLCRLASGRILASFRRGSAKDSADGNCVVAASEDNGQSWQVITEGFASTWSGRPGEIRCAELAELGDGTLLALLLWVDRSSGAKLYDGQADAVLPMIVLVARSRDGGRTWGACEKLDSGPLHGPALTGRILHLPAKGWLAFLENFEPEEPGGPSLHGAHALLSADGGSFNKVLKVARHPENTLFYWDQRQALCPKTGRIASMFWTYHRTEEKDVEIHMAWGDPRALTWETPFSTGLRGQIAAPIPLADGRLLAFYVHRHAPGAMKLIVSRDAGRTWDASGEMTIYSTIAGRERGMAGESNYAKFWEDMNTWTFGHPASVLLDERTVLLAYYAGPSDKCLSPRWARVRA